MKRHFWTLTIAVLCAAYGCSESDLTIPPFEAGPENTTPDDPTDPENPENPEGPAVLFFDDFDGTRVRPRYWRACPWKTPAWAYFLGHFTLDQHVVEEGYLKLQAVDPLLYGATLEEQEIPGGKKWHPWTYGIDTRGKFAFRYGEIQVRAKFSKAGPGGWPAIWLMPADEYDEYDNPNGVMWPEGGEIDIMERWDLNTRIQHALHYKSADGKYDRYKTKSVSTTTADVNLDLDGFNTYGIRKSPDKIEFIVNGVVTQAYTREDVEGGYSKGKWPYEDRDFYIILNHACASIKEYGIRSGYYNWLPSTDNLPYEMIVDWVKVTELPKAETPETPEE